MKKAWIILMIVVMVTSLTACGNGSALVGKWENKAMESYYEFDSNGEGRLSFFGVLLTFDYEDDGMQVTMTITGEEAELLKNDGENLTDVLPYEINGDALNIMGTIFTKVE